MLFYQRICWSVKRRNETASVNTDSQLSKQEACFARATHVWLTVNHNTSITSGKWIRCSKCIARASELGSCQSNWCHSWGYERLQISKDSLKACFENVNIHLCKQINVLHAVDAFLGRSWKPNLVTHLGIKHSKYSIWAGHTEDYVYICGSCGKGFNGELY